MNEVTTAGVRDVPAVENATITEYLDSTGLTNSLMPNEKAMFVNMCRGFGLNPFKREIYCTVYGQGEFRKCSIVTGFEVYLKRAERTGKLNGWHVDSTGNVKDGTLSATITIRRKDWAEPFTHTVYYSECVQTNKDGKPNSVWAKQPSYMTKKVAMGQGFRLCFPDELGGMPYTDDEMGDDIGQVRNVTPMEEPVRNEVREEQKVPPKDDGRKNEASLKLEQLINEFGMELTGQPYKLASGCLKNPESTEADYAAMYDRCVAYLARMGIKVA
ncbi:MAG: phage recombination protein Bet [Treponema sp.]|nr:phage recombination protein Bet [Treponema sp.]